MQNPGKPAAASFANWQEAAAHAKRLHDHGLISADEYQRIEADAKSSIGHKDGNTRAIHSRFQRTGSLKDAVALRAARQREGKAPVSEPNVPHRLLPEPR